MRRYKSKLNFFFIIIIRLKYRYSGYIIVQNKQKSFFSKWMMTITKFFDILMLYISVKKLNLSADYEK